MAFNTSSITSVIFQWGTSALFWTVGGIIILTFVLYFYLAMKRRTALKYKCLELVPFGNGKCGVNMLKAGIFKSHMKLGGLINYGSENLFRVADGRRILNAKTSYLHDIMGKKGFYLLRKPDDPKILVPIKSLRINGMELIMEIAPADYRDASVNILNDAVKETTGTWEKILPYIAVGLIVVLCIITVIINQQMTNNTVDKVGKILIGGCQNAQSGVPGGTP